MYYGNIKTYDIANGPGVRVSLFVSGCRLHCPNCFNKVAQDFSYGSLFSEETKNFIWNELNKAEVKGLTILGGEPFEPENIKELEGFIIETKEKFPTKTIWMYSGYRFELLWNREDCKKVFDYIDVLVDGPFKEELKNPSLAFRGSSNQRIINMRSTMNLIHIKYAVSRTLKGCIVKFDDSTFAN